MSIPVPPHTVCLLLAGLLAASMAAAADRVAELPAAWRASLLPVAEVDPGALGESERASLREAREQVDGLLGEGGDAPALAEAYGRLGALYHVYQVYRPADDCYVNATRLDPENFRWIYYAGYLAAENGRTALAIERLEKARTLEPGYRAVTLRLADAWLDRNEQARARTAYTAVLHDEGLEAAAHYGLGQIALLNREYDQAIEAFGAALEKDPEATSIHYPLAQALRATGQDEAAARHLAQRGKVRPAIRDPMVESLLALRHGASRDFAHGMQAMQQRDYAAAAAAFARGLEQEPDNADARITYARMLYLANDTDAARRELERVAAADPDRTLARFLLGALHAAMDEPDRAAAAWEAVVQDDPAHAGANYYLANRHFARDDYARARGHYTRSIESDPANLGAWLPQLACLQETGASDARLAEFLQAARHRFPDNPVFTGWQARLQAVSDDPRVADAAGALQQAREMERQMPIPPHRELVALGHAGSGDFTAAVVVQEELVALAAWSAPAGELQRLDRMLAAYRDGRLPARADSLPAGMLQPPPFDAAGPFRDYPTARPY